MPHLSCAALLRQQTVELSAELSQFGDRLGVLHLVGRRRLPVDIEHAARFEHAALDVFETEPIEKDHPLLSCPQALLTSHVAWYSESSIPRLQRLAAEEAVRGLKGEPLANQVNR